MDAGHGNSRLVNITTLWTVVCRANAGLQASVSAAGVAQAQQTLVERYGKAVYRYLLGALHDADAAEELTQEFAVRLLQGGLRGADRERGRFRDFVKGVLFHLIADYHRRRKVQPKPLGAVPDVADPAAAQDQDRAFAESWRDELMNRAWNALATTQGQAGPTLAAVLRFRAQHPDLRSDQMAQELSSQLGKAVTAAWVRQALHRARDKFADLLIEEVVETLANPSADQLEQELVELGLLVYCEPALKRWRG
jgi:RNA polymerase sigma-70 factor (ECF subfamily)